MTRRGARSRADVSAVPRHEMASRGAEFNRASPNDANTSRIIGALRLLQTGSETLRLRSC